MNKNISDLISEFERIKNKNWIKSVNKGFGSIGLTFERELGKAQDSMYFPDYNGIEIKCTNMFSRYPLFLFTIAFDGPNYPEINRIVNKYGWPDKDFSNKNILFSKVNFNKLNTLPSNYKFKLEYDKDNQKIYLCVYNLKNQLIEKESFICIDSIYKHLTLKLNVLAYIHAKKKKIDNEEYFNYYQLDIYKINNFDRFMELLKNDIIEVSLISRISKSGNDKGRYRNKNLVFQIRKDNISKLFNKIYSSKK